MQLALCDGVIRTERYSCYAGAPWTQSWCDEYFHRLEAADATCFPDVIEEAPSGPVKMKQHIAIFTFSNEDTARCAHSLRLSPGQTVTVSGRVRNADACGSERDLEKIVVEYNKTAKGNDEDEYLILQCGGNSAHLNLIKEHATKAKRCVLFVHVSRRDTYDALPGGLNFLSAWELALVEDLSRVVAERPDPDREAAAEDHSSRSGAGAAPQRLHLVNALRERWSIRKVLNFPIGSSSTGHTSFFRALLGRNLALCFRYLRYPVGVHAPKHQRKVHDAILADRDMVEFLAEEVCLPCIAQGYVLDDETTASSGGSSLKLRWFDEIFRDDDQYIRRFAQVAEAVFDFFSRLVGKTLARWLCLMEQSCALGTFVEFCSRQRSSSSEEEDHADRADWFFLCKQFVSGRWHGSSNSCDGDTSTEPGVSVLDRVPDPTGPECYELHHALPALRLPFVKPIAECLNNMVQTSAPADAQQFAQRASAALGRGVWKRLVSRVGASPSDAALVYRNDVLVLALQGVFFPSLTRELQRGFVSAQYDAWVLKKQEDDFSDEEDLGGTTDHGSESEDGSVVHGSEDEVSYVQKGHAKGNSPARTRTTSCPITNVFRVHLFVREEMPRVLHWLYLLSMLPSAVDLRKTVFSPTPSSPRELVDACVWAIIASRKMIAPGAVRSTAADEKSSWKQAARRALGAARQIFKGTSSIDALEIAVLYEDEINLDLVISPSSTALGAKNAKGPSSSQDRLLAIVRNAVGTTKKQSPLLLHLALEAIHGNKLRDEDTRLTREILRKLASIPPGAEDQIAERLVSTACALRLRLGVDGSRDLRDSGSGVGSVLQFLQQLPNYCHAARAGKREGNYDIVFDGASGAPRDSNNVLDFLGCYVGGVIEEMTSSTRGSSVGSFSQRGAVVLPVVIDLLASAADKLSVAVVVDTVEKQEAAFEASIGDRAEAGQEQDETESDFRTEIWSTFHRCLWTRILAASVKRAHASGLLLGVDGGGREELSTSKEDQTPLVRKLLSTSEHLCRNHRASALYFAKTLGLDFAARLLPAVREKLCCEKPHTQEHEHLAEEDEHGGDSSSPARGQVEPTQGPCLILHQFLPKAVDLVRQYHEARAHPENPSSREALAVLSYGDTTCPVRRFAVSAAALHAMMYEVSGRVVECVKRAEAGHGPVIGDGDGRGGAADLTRAFRSCFLAEDAASSGAGGGAGGRFLAGAPRVDALDLLFDVRSSAEAGSNHAPGGESGPRPIDCAGNRWLRALKSGALPVQLQEEVACALEESRVGQISECGAVPVPNPQCRSNANTEGLLRIYTQLLCCNAVCLLPSLAPVKEYNRRRSAFFLPGMPENLQRLELLTTVAAANKFQVLRCGHCGTRVTTEDACVVNPKSLAGRKCDACGAIGTLELLGASSTTSAAGAGSSPATSTATAPPVGYFEHEVESLSTRSGARSLAPRQLRVLHFLGHCARFDARHTEADWKALVETCFEGSAAAAASFFVCLIARLLEDSPTVPTDDVASATTKQHALGGGLTTYESLVAWEAEFAACYVEPSLQEHFQFAAELSHGADDLLRLEVNECVAVDFDAANVSRASQDQSAAPQLQTPRITVEIGSGNFSFAHAYCKKHRIRRGRYLATSRESEAELKSRYADADIEGRAFRQGALFDVSCGMDIVDDFERCVSRVLAYCDGAVHVLMFHMPYAGPGGDHRSLMRAFFALAARVLDRDREDARVVFTLANPGCQFAAFGMAQVLAGSAFEVARQYPFKSVQYPEYRCVHGDTRRDYTQPQRDYTRSPVVYECVWRGRRSGSSRTTSDDLSTTSEVDEEEVDVRVGDPSGDPGGQPIVQPLYPAAARRGVSARQWRLRLLEQRFLRKTVAAAEVDFSQLQNAFLQYTKRKMIFTGSGRSDIAKYNNSPPPPRHPLLHYIFDRQAGDHRRRLFRLVKGVKAVVKWVLLVQTFLEGRVSRESARLEVCVRDFLADADLRDGGGHHQGEAASRRGKNREIFDGFQRVWNEALELGLLSRHECQPLPRVEMSLETPIVYSCYGEEDEGLYLKLLLAQLVKAQNDFVMQFQSCSPEHLQSPEVEENQNLPLARAAPTSTSFVPLAQAPDLLDAQLLSDDWFAGLGRFCCPGFACQWEGEPQLLREEAMNEYEGEDQDHPLRRATSGAQLLVGWSLMEGYVRERGLDGKVLLQNWESGPFAFKWEVRFWRTLSELIALVPQRLGLNKSVFLGEAAGNGIHHCAGNDHEEAEKTYLSSLALRERLGVLQAHYAEFMTLEGALPQALVEFDAGRGVENEGADEDVGEVGTVDTAGDVLLLFQRFCQTVLQRTTGTPDTTTSTIALAAVWEQCRPTLVYETETKAAAALERLLAEKQTGDLYALHDLLELELSVAVLRECQELDSGATGGDHVAAETTSKQIREMVDHLANRDIHIDQAGTGGTNRKMNSLNTLVVPSAVLAFLMRKVAVRAQLHVRDREALSANSDEGRKAANLLDSKISLHAEPLLMREWGLGRAEWPPGFSELRMRDIPKAVRILEEVSRGSCGELQAEAE
eukprot:g7417.t1